MWIRSQDKMELVPINSKLYIPSTGFSENVGIRGCIKRYKKMVGSDSNAKN